MDGVLDATTPILSELDSLTRDFVAFLPQLFGAVLLLLVGWLIARLLRTVTVRSTRLLDRLWRRLGRGGAAVSESARQSTVTIVSGIVFWVVILFFVTSAANLLGLTMFASWLDQLVEHLPNIISGLLIMGAGLILSILGRDATVAALPSLPKQQRDIIGRLVQIVVLGVLVVIGINQIGIDVTLVVTVFAIIFGALAAGLALAFSLGARVLVSNLLGTRYISRDYRIGERIRVGDVEGVILDITSTALVLDGPEGRVTIPAKIFSEQVSTLIGSEAPDGRS